MTSFNKDVKACTQIPTYITIPILTTVYTISAGYIYFKSKGLPVFRIINRKFNPKDISTHTTKRLWYKGQKYIQTEDIINFLQIKRDIRRSEETKYFYFGPPGRGKSYFLEELAKYLNSQYHPIIYLNQEIKNSIFHDSTYGSIMPKKIANEKWINKSHIGDVVRYIRYLNQSPILRYSKLFFLSFVFTIPAMLGFLIGNPYLAIFLCSVSLLPFLYCYRFFKWMIKPIPVYVFLDDKSTYLRSDYQDIVIKFLSQEQEPRTAIRTICFSSQKLIVYQYIDQITRIKKLAEHKNFDPALFRPQTQLTTWQANDLLDILQFTQATFTDEDKETIKNLHQLMVDCHWDIRNMTTVLKLCNSKYELLQGLNCKQGDKESLFRKQLKKLYYNKITKRVKDFRKQFLNIQQKE